jgi:sterol desaturase/sphingolipid hydroxylase (fatty acid hydroxylase superfamily)
MRGQTNFALFLTFLDRAFGTSDHQYEKHYESVVRSRGITRKELHESKSH